MKGFSILILVGFGIIFSADVFAQSDTQSRNELNPSDEDLIILFSVAIIMVLGIVIFLTR